MKNRLCLVCGVLAGMTIQHFTAFAENTQPSSTTTARAPTSAPLANEPTSEELVKECEDEWMADEQGMMKRGMTEDRYVEQCSVRDDVPTFPSELEKNAAPSSAPK
jgi:hypothetical protein